MRCAACGTELIAGKRFCHACGTRVAQTCRGCGATQEAEFRFCPDCGLEQVAPGVHDAAPPPLIVEDSLARLSQAIPDNLAHKIRAAQGAIEGERKQVTVLFCDLVGSTAIAERLDPEEYHDLLEQYLKLAFREIYRYEGIINQLAGDGLMALFGAPVAHEDAPQRAVLAALAIRAALSELAEELRTARGIPLRARIGIHTGPVVVGTIGNDLKMDYTAIGDTTNLAARLETLAEPGTILISDATQRLVRGFFLVQPTGPLEVKGKSAPILAYEVLEVSEAATPMGIAAERGLTPLVGRAEELAQLEACYRRLKGNQAQVVAVVGDAGSGKSRLLYEFKERLADEPVVFFEGRCASLSQAVPYSPFIAMLRHHFGLDVGEEAGSACAKMAARTNDGEGGNDERMYPLLRHLLSTPIDQLRELPPDELKRQAFDAVARIILGESARAPVVLIIEDLHWIDDPSRELIESLVARLGSARVMVVISQRPDGQPSWRAQAAFTQLVLRRLDDDEVTAIVRSVAGAPLPGELERLLVAKAEGSPFFAEEITRSLIEEGYWVRDNGRSRLTRPVEEIHIPSTVQEVIAARLDRLGPAAKRVLQVAAVLGRQFSRRRLVQLFDGEGIDVGRELEELERRGLLHRKTLQSSDDFRFGESLTQEVAYEGLLMRQRRQLHERIGLLIEGSPSEPGAERSALLAHHFARSDNRAKAVEALLRAAEEAERLPSYRVAADFFQQAWQLAEAGGSEDHFRRAALGATRGIARLSVFVGRPPPAEAEPAARRGRELAEALGDTEALASLLYFHGVITMLGDRQSFERGMALAEQGLAVAERAGLKLLAMGLSRGLAVNYVLDGRFELARRTIGWVMDELEQADQARLSDLYVSARWIRDNILLLSDDLEGALASLAETYALAVRAPNHTVTGGAAGTLAQAHFLRGEYAEALHWADVSLEVSEAIANQAAFPGAASVALAARVELGEPTSTDRYLELIEQGIAAGGTMQSNFRFVADAFRAVGDRARAERFADALRTNPSGSGRLRETFAATARGQLLTDLGRYEEAERSFTQAMALAESIGARSTLAVAALGMAELAATRSDQPVSRRHAERALAISRELGLGRYVSRAERLLAGLDGASAQI